MTQFYPIKMLRLTTGETLVSGIGDHGKNTYILERPMLLSVMVVDQDDSMPQQVSVGLKDWIDFCADDYIPIRKDLVVCIVKPVAGIVSDYMQAKINSDIMDDMVEQGNPPTVESEFGEGSDSSDGGLADEKRPEKDENDEFPGWGGNPRFGY